MRSRLGRLLDLRAGEGTPTFLFLGHSLFVGLFVMAFFSAANVIFLSNFEIRLLPFAYVGSGAVGYLFGSLFGHFQRRMGFVQLLVGTLVLLLLLAAAFRFGLESAQSLWVGFLLFVFVMPMVTLVQLEYWGLANRFFNLEQGKRLFGLISSGDVVASIVGFFGLVVIIEWVGGVENLVWVAAAGLLGCLLFLTAIVLRYPELSHEEEVEPTESPKPRSKLKELFRDRYLGLMALASVCSILGLYFVDFAFMGEIRSHFGSGEGLARFIGIFFGLAKTLELVVKTTISGRLVRQYGLKVALLALPAGLALPVVLAQGTSFFGEPEVAVAGAAGGLFFVMVAIAKLVDRLARKAIEEPSFKLLYQPLPRERRLAGQARIEAIRQASQGLAGVVLILLATAGWGDPSTVLWILAGTIVVWFVAVVVMHRQYHAILVRALSSHRSADLTRSTLERWSDELRAADPFVVSHSISLLRHVEPYLVPRLVNDLELSGDPAMLAAVREGVTRGAAGRETKELSVQLAERDLAETLLGLAGSVDPDDRVRAARLLGSAKGGDHAGILLGLLGDQHAPVCLAAAEAAAEVRDPSVAPRLLELLGRPEVAGAATAAMVALGDTAVPILEQASAQSGVAPEVVMRVPTALGQIGGPRAQGVLFKLISHPSREVRVRALEVLGGSGYRSRPEDLSFITSRIDTIIEEIAWKTAGALDLVGQREFEDLRRQLRRERDEHLRLIFLLLALLYDREAIELVKNRYDTGSPEGRAYALEIIDVIVTPQLRARLLPLLEDLTEAQRLHRLSDELPQQRMRPLERARDVVTVGYSRVSRWTRAQALAVIAERSPDLGDELLAHLYNPDPLMSEVAALAIHRLDPALLGQRLESMPAAAQQRFEGLLPVNGAGTPQRLTVFEKTRLLKESPVFAEVPAAGLVGVAAETQEMQLGDGDWLLREGETADTMYIVVDGEVDVSFRGRLLGQVGPGGVLGEIAVVELGTRSADVAANRPSRFLEISQRAVFRLMSERTEVIHAILSTISQRRREAQEKSE